MASSTVLNGREIKEKDWIIGKDWITGVVDYYHKANNLNPENANVLYNYYILTYLFDSPNKKWQKNAIELNPNYINESENEFNFIDLRTNRSLFGLWSPKYIDNHYALIGSYTKLINGSLLQSFFALYFQVVVIAL